MSASGRRRAVQDHRRRARVSRVSYLYHIVFAAVASGRISLYVIRVSPCTNLSERTGPPDHHLKQLAALLEMVETWKGSGHFQLVLSRRFHPGPSAPAGARDSEIDRHESRGVKNAVPRVRRFLRYSTRY